MATQKFVYVKRDDDRQSRELEKHRRHAAGMHRDKLGFPRREGDPLT